MDRQDYNDVKLVFNVLSIRRQTDDTESRTVTHIATARCTLRLTAGGRDLSIATEICSIKSYSCQIRSGHPSYAVIKLDKPFELPLMKALVPDERRVLDFGEHYTIEFDLELIGTSPWPPVHFNLEQATTDKRSRSHWRMSSTATQAQLNARAYKTSLDLHLQPPRATANPLPTEYYLEYEIKYSVRLRVPPSCVSIQPPLSELVKQVPRRRNLITRAARAGSSGLACHVEVLWVLETLEGDPCMRTLGALVCVLCLRDESGRRRASVESLKQHLWEFHEESLIDIADTPNGISVRCRPHGLLSPQLPCLEFALREVKSQSSPSPSLELLPPEASIQQQTSLVQVADIPATAPNVHKRLFHPQSLAELRPGDGVPPLFVDTSWIRRRNIDRANNLPSVGRAEKEYATRWVTLLDEHPEESDAYFSVDWLRFVVQNSQWIVASPERMQQFNKDVIILAALGILDDETIEKGNAVIHTARVLAEKKPEGNTDQPLKLPGRGCGICNKSLSRANTLRCAYQKCLVRVHKTCVPEHWKSNYRYDNFRCESCLEHFARFGFSDA